MQRFSLEQPLPSELTVLEARDAYLAENEFDTEGYDADSVTVNFWGIRFTVPNPPSRKLAIRYHDLHHVMTGYGTDPTGESEISTWEFRRGIGVFGLYVQLIILSGMLFGFIHSPIATLKAWQTGKSGNRLPTPSMKHYESVLGLTLGELRLRYGLPKEGLTGPRRLNHDVAKRV